METEETTRVPDATPGIIISGVNVCVSPPLSKGQSHCMY